MAQNNGTSLEDVNKTAQPSGVFNSVLNTAEDIGEGVLNFGKSILGTGADMIGDTAQAAVNLGKNIITGDVMKSFDLSTVGKPKQQFNEFEEKQAEKLNSISGMTMASDILGTIKDFTYKPVKEYLLGNELTNNLKVDKKDFEANVGYLKSGLDEINKKYENLNKDKYKTFLSFNDRVYQQYLKEKGTTNILDQEDFELYKQQELKRLNGIEQAAIAREQSQYMLDTASIEEEKLRKEEELKKYLNENISTDGTKTGEQFYNEFLEKESENIKQREYINTIGEIYNYSKEQVEAGLEAKGLSKNSDFAGYDALKESIIDDITAENQYMMSIKGMKDLPEYEELASQAKEVRDVSLEFKLDFAKKFLDIRNNPENKGLTNVELKNKALKSAWDEMSLDKKQIFKTKEELVAKVATLKNLQEAKDRAKNFDPRALLDIVSAGVSTIQGVIDQAYDFDTEDVPHFVKQDTRNLVYSGEGIGKAIATSITYNPDALVDLVIGTKGVTKIANGARAVADALNTSDKIMKITSKIGYGQGTYNLLSKSVKNLTSSQVYGTVGDTVLDNVMEEAPTKGIETFNFISNLLFDSTPFVYREAKDGLTQSTSMNRISYEFLNGDQKKAVQQFADTMSAKTGTKMGLGEAKVILDNGVKGLYHTLYNPNEYKDILTKQGGLYEFVGNQINGLSKDKLDKVLTEKGISLQYTDTVQGISNEEFRDVNKAVTKYINSQGVEKQFQEIRMNEIINFYKEKITPGLGGDQIVIDKKKIDKDFIALKDNAIEALNKLKEVKNINQAKDLMETYNYNLTEARRKYSNKEFKKMVHLIDPAGNNIQISFKEFSELQDKNLLDLKRDGKVKITKNGVDTEYTFKTQKQLNLEESYNNFLDTKKDEIDSFEKQYGVTGGGLRQQLNNLLFGRGVSKASWAEGDTEKLTAFAELSTKIINDFLGNKYVADKPVHINKVIPNKDEYALRSGDDIREYMTKHDSYVNISYGEFKDMSSGKITNAIYLMPGKRLLDNKIIGRYFNGLNNDGKVIFGVLKEQGNKIIKDIIELGMDGNKFDFERGKVKTISVLSAGDIDGIFDEAGLIKKSTIDKIISETLGKQANEDISKFIYEAVKDLDQSQSLTIKPIIYNLSYNYLNNKELIDQVIKSQDISFQSIFADILLSPQIREKIVKNIYGSRSIPDKYKEVHEGLLSKFESEWELYKERLIQRKLLLQAEKNELNDLLSNNKLTDVQVVNIEKEIKTIDNRILAVEKELRSKGTFIKGISNQELLRLNTEFLKNKSLQASGTMLGASLDYLRKGLNLKPIDNLKEQSDKVIEIAKEISKKEPKRVDELIAVRDKIIANEGNIEAIKKIIEETKDDWIKKIVLELINDGGLTTINKKVIMDLQYKDAVAGVTQYEFAINNNPLKKSIKGLLNNSNTGRDSELDNIFIKHFGVEKEGARLEDIYNTEAFQKFKKDIIPEYKDTDSYDKIIAKSKIAKLKFNKEIKKIFNSVIYKARKNGEVIDITKELVDDLIKDDKLFQNIKAIANRQQLKTGDGGVGVIIKKVGDDYEVVDEAFTEIPIQLKMMMNNIKDTNGESRIKYLVGFNNDVFKTINYPETFDKYYKKYIISKFEGNEDNTFLKKALQISPIEKLIIFKEYFNKNKIFDNDFIIEHSDAHIDNFGLTDYRNKGYAFVGGFGDKDSGMHLYKAPDEILQFSNNANEASEIYNIIEYAYSVGYLRKKREGFREHKDFLEKFVSYLKDKGYEQSQEIGKGNMDGDTLFKELEIFTGSKKYSLNDFKKGNVYFPDGFKLNEEHIKLIKKLKDETYNPFEFLKSLTKIDGIDDEIKKELKDILNKGNIISLKDIRKRESFNTSVRETFGGLKKQTKLYIIPKLELEVPKVFDKYKDLDFDKITNEEIEQYISELKNLEKDNLGIKDQIDYLRTVNGGDDLQFLKEVHVMLSNGYYNDMQDGTSFVSNMLGELRAAINGININDKKVKGAYRQFKDHFFGEIDGARIGGKTLFNLANITGADGKAIDNAVAIGESSLKLGKDFIDDNKFEDIIINGRKVRAKVIEGTDTSFFKNAGSDSFDFSAEVSFSDSIKSSLSLEAQDEITKWQKKQIQKLFDETLKGLLDTDIKFTSESNIDISLIKFISQNKMGYSSNSFIGGKLDEFIKGVQQIIDKPQEGGQAAFIYESNARIKPNEVIMHSNSELVQRIRGEVIKAKFPDLIPDEIDVHKVNKIYQSLTAKEKNIIDDNLFTVGYRYPVPSKYNMGVYKIKLHDTYSEIGEDGKPFNPYHKMGTEHVVSHPIATYMKLEGDNDGDHIFFISTNSEIGKIVTKDISSVEVKNIDSLKEAFDDGILKNKFIALFQVKKDGEIVVKDEKLLTLANSRIAALNAKAYIGNVSATIRTIKNLAYMKNKMPDGVLPVNIGKEYVEGESNFGYETLSKITDIYDNLNTTDPVKARQFAAKAAQLLQDTLDFGNSGKAQFDTDWYNRLLEAAGIPEDKQDLIQAKYITPSSMSYKPEMDYWNLPQIVKDINGTVNKDGQLIKLNLDKQKNAGKFLHNITGSKKELINQLLFDIKYEFKDTSKGSLTIPEIIRAFNKSHDFKFMLEKFKTSMDNLIKKDSKTFGPLKEFYNKYLTGGKIDNRFEKDFLTETNRFSINDGGNKITYYKPTEKQLEKFVYPNLIKEEFDDIKEVFTNGFDNVKWKYELIDGEKKYKGIGLVIETFDKKTKKDKKSYFSIGAYEYLYALTKSQGFGLTNFVDKYIRETNKKSKQLLGEELFNKLKSKGNEDEKNIMAMLLLAGGEKKLVNILNEADWYDFLTESDVGFKTREITGGIRIQDLFKDLGIKFPDEVDEIIPKLNNLEDKLSELEKQINKLKSEGRDDEVIQKVSEYEKVNEDILSLKTHLEELETLKNTEEKYIEKLSPAKIEPIRQEYVFPGTSETLIDIDPRGVDVLVGESEGMVNKTRRGLVFRVSQFFKDYTPKFLFDYNNINDKLGIRNENILEAYKTHHLQFNEYYRNKEGVISMLKNAGLEKYDEMGKKMQYELLDYKNGRFILKDDFIPSIKRHLEGTLAASLIDNQTFIKALTDYQKGTITHVVKVLNDLEDMGFKVHANYIKEPYSLVTDVLEAHKADPQLALRLNGFLNEEQFKIFVRESAVSKGIDLKQGTLQTMIDVLYKSQGKWYDKVLGFLKMTHYSMNYGTMSLVTGNGIMSGLAQMLPNYIELRSYMRKNITDIKNGFTIMQRFGLLDAESVIMFGTGIGKDFNDSGYLDAALDKAFKSVTDKNIKGSKSAAFIHSVLTNPLGGSDYPIENLRKLVAISNTMKRFGLETPNDLERKIALHGSEFEGLFRHHVREAFAESGGGVNSSSAIYRDTIFSHLHNYADIWGVRFFTQTVGYLMGWSFRKTATLIEKESALGYGLRDLVKGNYKSAKGHLDDWFTYNSMIAHQMAMAMGIFMKMEKYEKDTNDRVSFDDFAKTFMNSVVSFQILVEKHLNAWESADEAGGTTQDKIGYTTIGMIRHMFRLFGQTNFIATMYKHYTYSQLEGKANLFDSLQFAMNEHYSSFIRFNGIDQLENIYNTLGQEGRSAMLGTGAKTEEEKLLQDLQNGNYFGIYKEKGFIKGMYDMFDSLLLKNSKSVPVGLQSIISKDLVELVMQDKELSKLIRGGEFGQEEGNYNIERLFGKIGTNMNEEQAEGVNDIFKQLKDYTYDYLKANGKKVDSFTQSTIDRMLQDEIDNALKKEGINIEDLIAASPYSPDTTKTLAVLETKYGLKNPLVISTLIEREYSKQLKELKDSKGKFTGEISEYGKAYKDLTEEDKLNLKRDLLVKYQKYFNLNRQLGMDIIAQDIKMNHSDKLDKLKETVDSYGSAGEDMMNFIQKSYLIGQVAKEGDTSVSKLHSKYALAAKGLAANETTVVIVNKFLHKLFEQEGLSHKEKLANAAGFLSGLNKATYGMLSNNEEFNKLTEDSRKLLANWVFKINSDAMKYDSNDLLNDLSNKSYGGNGSGSAYRKMYPKYKSNSFEGQRPNFSKQFAPISKMIPNTIQYVSKDPDGYLRGTSPYIDTQGVYNNMKSPFMKQYSKLLIEQLFYGYKSKGIIRPMYNEAKVDNEYKKSINIKKSKSVKQPKEFKRPKVYKKHQKNVFANGSLNTYDGN